MCRHRQCTYKLDLIFVCFCSDNFHRSFKLLEDDADALSLNFSSWLAGPFKVKFSMDKLVTALGCCCNMSPNPNSIHNQMPSHLPPPKQGVSVVHVQPYMARELVPAA